MPELSLCIGLWFWEGNIETVPENFCLLDDACSHFSVDEVSGSELINRAQALAVRRAAVLKA